MDNAKPPPKAPEEIFPEEVTHPKNTKYINFQFTTKGKCERRCFLKLDFDLKTFLTGLGYNF